MCVLPRDILLNVVVDWVPNVRDTMLETLALGKRRPEIQKE